MLEFFPTVHKNPGSLTQQTQTKTKTPGVYVGIFLTTHKNPGGLMQQTKTKTKTPGVYAGILFPYS